MADLRISGLHKYYGSMHAVKDIDLEIPSGEFTVLVGQSGCGKSTLLRTIAGLEEIDQGTVQISGQTVNDLAPKDRDIAMVFQNYALYPYMKIFDNIAFGLRARKVEKTEINKKVDHVSKMLSIDHLLDRYPRQLSGGQLQRVAIGRAIVREARIYLFDEPLSNLDAQLRDEMRGEIKRLHKELGKTMIYVTHGQIEAMTMADRIVLIRDGKIEQQGTPSDLYDRPKTKYVAGFLGSPSMNFITARVVTQGLGYGLILENTAAQLKMPENVSQRIGEYLGSNILIGIRPEHFSLNNESKPEDSGTTIEVSIDLVKPTGARTYVSFKIGQVTAVAELNPRDIRQNESNLTLNVDVNRCVLINKDTEFSI